MARTERSVPIEIIYMKIFHKASRRGLDELAAAERIERIDTT
jgi:hypothetical protein